MLLTAKKDMGEGRNSHIFFAFLSVVTAATVVLVVIFAVKPRFIEGGIVHIEILFVAGFVLGYAQSITETLIVYYFSCAKEFDYVAYVGIVGKAEYVVVGNSRFLFCCELIRRTRREKPP